MPCWNTYILPYFKVSMQLTILSMHAESHSPILNFSVLRGPIFHSLPLGKGRDPSLGLHLFRIKSNVTELCWSCLFPPYLGTFPMFHPGTFPPAPTHHFGAHAHLWLHAVCMVQQRLVLNWCWPVSELQCALWTGGQRAGGGPLAAPICPLRLL